MNREEFFKWLNTYLGDCEIIQDDYGCIWVSFGNIIEEEEEIK